MGIERMFISSNLIWDLKLAKIFFDVQIIIEIDWFALTSSLWDLWISTVGHIVTDIKHWLTKEKHIRPLVHNHVPTKFVTAWSAQSWPKSLGFLVYCQLKYDPILLNYLVFSSMLFNTCKNNVEFDWNK